MQASSLRSYVLAGVGVTALLFALKPNKQKMESLLMKTKQKLMPGKKAKEEIIPIEKAGNPHPLDIEDNNMVSEGAMYSVNYYNETKQQK